MSIDRLEDVETSLAKWRRAEDVDYIVRLLFPALSRRRLRSPVSATQLRIGQVVSDGEEILGIGDQGVGAVLISVAKLVLTTVCAGVHPGRVLPVVLDCGTDNAQLLHDELYMGLRRPRVRGERYDAFVDRFVTAARQLYPRAYIHFEDFGLGNARRILDRYRPQIPCFNDDVQGTGCVTLAAIMAGLHVSGLQLADLRLVVFGSGSAGTGIADQVRDAIATDAGKSKEEAAKQIW